jgi:hypothetical protein
VTPVLVLVAVLAAFGAVVATAARVPRAAVLGLVLALTAAPFVADPAPPTLAVATRLVAAVLAGYALWAAVRPARVSTEGSGLGWPGAMALGIALLAAGWLAAGQVGAALGIDGLERPGTGATGAALAAGSPVARAAFASGLAVLALAAAPVLIRRDALRLVVGLLLLLTGAGLIDASLHQPGESASVVVAALTAGTGLASAGIVRRALATPTASFALAEPSIHEAAVRARQADDAHPAGRSSARAPRTPPTS